MQSSLSLAFGLVLPFERVITNRVGLGFLKSPVFCLKQFIFSGDQNK